MWNLKDSNVHVGVFMKVESFKKHLTNIKNTKSQLSINKTNPWKPTFILSQNKNRYNKNKNIQITHENEHLLKKIINMETNPKINTILNIPHYIPSNKQNYAMFKSRQRQNKSKLIQRQNISISFKINTVSKSYDRKQFQNDWKTSRVYKRTISKKQKLYDFRKLAESQITKLVVSRTKNLRKSVDFKAQFRDRKEQNLGKNLSVLVCNKKQDLTNFCKSKFKKVY